MLSDVRASLIDGALFYDDEIKIFSQK